MPEEYGTESLVQEFIAEANELFEVLDRDLLEAESRSRAGDTTPCRDLDEMFRAVHTIKGLSSMFDLVAIKELAHAVEDVFDRMRKGDMVPDGPCLDLLLRSVGTLKQAVAAFEAGAADDAPVEAAGDEIRAYLSRPRGTDVQPAQDATVVGAGLAEYSLARIRSAPDEGLRAIRLVLRWGIELRLGALRRRDVESALGESGEVLEVKPLVDELARVEDVHPTEGDMRFEVLALTSRTDEEIADALGVGRGSISALGAPQPAPVATEQAGVAGTVPAEREDAAPAPGHKAGASGEQMPAERRRGPDRRSAAGIMRVDIERLDGLVELTGEIVTARTRLQELSSRLSARYGRDEAVVALHVAVKETGALVESLQDTVMGLRMVPIGHVFAKLPRVVRDITRSSGKEIRLALEGEDTELDKRVIDRMEEPLLHILRNACDHGIEPPEQRAAAGKDPTGVVTLSARQEGSHIVLDCRDDGRGLDMGAILAKAIEQGIVDMDEAPTPRAIADIITAPGFTTSGVITDVSGRGVGLDVVSRGVTELGGEVEVSSAPGQGTTFTLRIPLTLAIIPALIAVASAHTLAVPLAVVAGVLRVRASEVRRINGVDVLDLRGETIPVLRLGEVLRLGDGAPQPRHFIIEATARGQKVALLVDALLGRQEIVVKNLEDAVGDTPGIAGATILGNGSIVPILDVDGIVRLREGSLKEAAMAETAGGGQ